MASREKRMREKSRARAKRNPKLGARSIGLLDLVDNIKYDDLCCSWCGEVIPDNKKRFCVHPKHAKLVMGAIWYSFDRDLIMVDGATQREFSIEFLPDRQWCSVKCIGQHDKNCYSICGGW